MEGSRGQVKNRIIKGQFMEKTGHFSVNTTVGGCACIRNNLRWLLSSQPSLSKGRHATENMR